MMKHLLLHVLPLASSVAAHGWIGSVRVASGSTNKLFTGPKPTEESPSPPSSIIRQIANNLPVKDTTSAELTCGRSATPASQVASVAAGSTLAVTWQTLTDTGFWFHDVGPMMAYMADCGSGSCAEFDASEARWFKIQEQGVDKSGNWAQAKLDDGSPASVTIPANLKPGNYLLRHEIIALHTAQSPGGAEFYTGCAQLSVTGSGTGGPAADETVKIPGAYKPTDPGILIDVYDMKGAYKFPGPAVAAFVGGAKPAEGGPTSTTKAGTTSTSTKKSTSPSPSASATPSSAPSTTPGSPSCKAKRQRQRRARAVREEVEVREEIDVREEVRRSRVRHMHLHRAGAKVVRSF
ncbi:glycosyl hydrolase family 61-domain-containing protein [Mycena amicta]|nr:glycosyl hydrolase family 61-domain-containing protein [Mycena amicta]